VTGTEGSHGRGKAPGDNLIAVGVGALVLGKMFGGGTGPRTLPGRAAPLAAPAQTCRTPSSRPTWSHRKSISDASQACRSWPYGLSGQELRALRKLKRESGGNPFVFVSERGAPFSVSGFRRMIERASQEAGACGLEGSAANDARRPASLFQSCH
jgi:hypothetical protein